MTFRKSQVICFTIEFISKKRWCFFSQYRVFYYLLSDFQKWNWYQSG